MTIRPDRRSLSLAAAACLLFCLTGGPALADDRTPEVDPLNHAYAVYLGSGLYFAGGRSVFVFRLAPRFKLRSADRHAFGIGVRINTTFGFYDLKPDDFLNFEVPDQLGTVALVPEVEFPVKIYDHWTLSPFLGVGPAADTAFQDVTLVVGTGAHSRAEFHDKKYVYLLWNSFIYAINSSATVRSTDDYTVFRTDFEMRGLVKYRLGKRPMDLGPLVRWEFFFDTVLVDLPLGNEVTIRSVWEVGLSTGSTKPWKHLKKLVTAPRIGVSYRRSNLGSSVRFVLRFRN